MLPYTAEILQLSTEIPHLGTLLPPATMVTVVSPVCGSRISLSVLLADGRVERFAWEIEACALGQASAALVGARAVGWRLEDVDSAAQALDALLKSNAPLPPSLAWLTPLIPVQSVPQRHGSVLLPLRAFQKAFSSSTGRI